MFFFRNSNKIGTDCRLQSRLCVCFTLPVFSQPKAHTGNIWVDVTYCIIKMGGYWSHLYSCQCAWEGRGVLHSKRSPKCGILSSKLRSPVCKGRRRRRWGCGSVRAVSVWPAHVTCLLLRAMAVAKGAGHQGNGGCYGAGRHGGGSGCQLVYELVWWGTFAGITGRCTEHCSRYPCLWFPPPLTKGTHPEVCFSNMPECTSLNGASF